MSNNRLDIELPSFVRANDGWLLAPDAMGRLEVKCDIPLAEGVDGAKLQGRLDRYAELEFEAGHIDYLKNEVSELESGFLDYLKKTPLPRAVVKTRGENLMVRVDGSVVDLHLWEAPISNHIHDLYHNWIVNQYSLDRDTLALEGVRRLQHKVDLLRGTNFGFVEAGTRWRYAWDWYELVVTLCLGDIPNVMLGTTNPYTAMIHGMQLWPSMTEKTFYRLENPSIQDVEASIEKKDEPIVVFGANAYQMAHLHSHFGNRLAFEWGADLTGDWGPGGGPLPLRFEIIR